MLDALEAVVLDELSNDEPSNAQKVRIAGIVQLTVRVKAAQKKRLGRNPATGEQITIAAKPASVERAGAAVDSRQAGVAVGAEGAPAIGILTQATGPVLDVLACAARGYVLRFGGIASVWELIVAACGGELLYGQRGPPIYRLFRRSCAPPSPIVYLHPASAVGAVLKQRQLASIDRPEGSSPRRSSVLLLVTTCR